MTARKVFTQKRCTVCNSPDRVLIEASHVAGASLDSIALRFKGVSRDAIWRHMAKHVSDSDRAHYLAAIPHEHLAEAAAAEGISVLQYFSIIRATLMSQFQLANSINDRVGVSALAGRLTEVLRAIGGISGEMSSLAANSISITNNVNILNSPVYASLQANLLQALAPYPDARAAVVQALRQIDHQQDAPPMKMLEIIPEDEFAAKKVATHVPPEQNQSVSN